MANTVIQLKWSEVTASPTTLNVAEPAYSNTSGKLYVGGTNQTPILIGGKYYVDRVDEATSSNTANVIVKRDSEGAFSASYVRANLYGNANSATILKTARTISVTGDVDANSVSFDGSQNIELNLELTNTGVTAGNYGGTGKIGVFNVDVDGRITSAANTDVATTLSISGDSGTDTVNLLSGTLNFEGGDGITSTVTNDKASFAVDNTVIRNSGAQAITGDLAVTGNLVVIGASITQNVSTITTTDSLIELSANNAADALDIGFFGTYVNSGTKYTTLFRDASDSGKFKLLTGGTEKPSAGNTVNTLAFSTATLVTNLSGGTVSGLTANIAISDGGTNANYFPTGNLVMFDGTRLVGIANTGTSGTYGAADRTQVITTDAYGRVAALSTASITTTLSTAGGTGTGTVALASQSLTIAGGTGITTAASGQAAWRARHPASQRAAPQQSRAPKLRRQRRCGPPNRQQPDEYVSQSCDHRAQQHGIVLSAPCPNVLFMRDNVLLVDAIIRLEKQGWMKSTSCRICRPRALSGASPLTSHRPAKCRTMNSNTSRTRVRRASRAAWWNSKTYPPSRKTMAISMAASSTSKTPSGCSTSPTWAWR